VHVRRLTPVTPLEADTYQQPYAQNDAPIFAIIVRSYYAQPSHSRQGYCLSMFLEAISRARWRPLIAPEHPQQRSSSDLGPSSRATRELIHQSRRAWHHIQPTERSQGA
jgi:hypothetical protein